MPRIASISEYSLVFPRSEWGNILAGLNFPSYFSKFILFSEVTVRIAQHLEKTLMASHSCVPA